METCSNKLCRMMCRLVVVVMLLAASYSTTAFVFSPYHHASLVKSKSFFTVSSIQEDSIVSTSFGGKPFWSEGLNFSCTACGKCCQNKGDVWLNTEEFALLADSLKLPVDDVMQIYVEEVQGGWVRLKSKKVMDTSSSHGGEGSLIAEECIFLSDDDHKTCTIYQQRPVQCRTYPYWSNLLTSRKQWEKERVDPAGMTEGRSGRNWSIQDGGCEGIEPTHVDSKLVPPRHIYLNQELYGRYLDSFPFMKSEYDGNRLKTTTKMIQVL